MNDQATLEERVEAAADWKQVDDVSEPPSELDEMTKDMAIIDEALYLTPGVRPGTLAAHLNSPEAEIIMMQIAEGYAITTLNGGVKEHYFGGQSYVFNGNAKAEYLFVHVDPSCDVNAWEGVLVATVVYEHRVNGSAHLSTLAFTKDNFRRISLPVRHN